MYACTAAATSFRASNAALAASEQVTQANTPATTNRLRTLLMAAVATGTQFRMSCTLKELQPVSKNPTLPVVAKTIAVPSVPLLVTSKNCLRFIEALPTQENLKVDIFANDLGVILGVMNSRTFTVDWDSAEGIDRVLHQLKSRIGELHARDGKSKRARKFEQLQACQQILETDISSVYAELPLDSERKYYVYAHLDPSRKIAVGVHSVTTFAATLGLTFFPFYIGKGIGDRCFDLNRSETHRKIVQRIKARGQDVEVVKLREGLTESEALQFEAKLIDIFGLIPYKGRLANLDEGMKPQERRSLYREALLTLRDFQK
jgi:hypothetical protein